MKKNILLVILISGLYVKAQNKSFVSNYIINEIPAIEKFEILTNKESDFALRKQQYNIEKLKMFSDGASDEEKRIINARFKINSRNYRDNRSRYFINHFRNGIKNRGFISKDTLTSECDCVLNRNKINIIMGDLGFSFNITIDSAKFTSSYWFDGNMQFYYKKAKIDSLFVDNLRVYNNEQALILKKRPRFLVDEKILGYLTFKTDDFYENNEKTNSYDTLNVSGNIYFKCFLRKHRFD